jgi:hypothetical protein
MSMHFAGMLEHLCTTFKATMLFGFGGGGAFLTNLNQSNSATWSTNGIQH